MFKLGNTESMLDNITFENVGLEIIGNDNSALQLGRSAIFIDNATNLRLKDFAFHGELPVAANFRGALMDKNVHGLILDGVCGPPILNGSSESGVISTKLGGLDGRNSVSL